MTRHNHEDMKIAEEAASWLLRLQREDTPAVRAEFSAWIRKGATNLQEFLFAQAIWRELDNVEPAVAARFAASTDDSDHTVVDLMAARSAVPRLSIDDIGRTPCSVDGSAVTARVKARRWGVGLAASVAALALTWLLLAIYPGGTRTYSTAIGDQKAIKLDDGSVALLNTDSKVEIRYSGARRGIRLLKGEALFTVEKDASRPFVVTTDNAEVRAVGTQFNVYRDRSSVTRIAVLNGIVEVAEAGVRPSGSSEPAKFARLIAGDEAHVDAHGRIAKEAAPNVQRAIAWRQRRLIFSGNSIADVAEEFNRYNHAAIHVTGEEIRQRRMSGVFDADDPAPLIRFLARDPGVEVVTTDTEIFIRPSSAALP